MNERRILQIIEGRLFKIGIFVLIFLALGYMCLLMLWNHSLRKSMGPGPYEEMKTFFKEDVTVPEEWLEPISYPDEVLEKMLSVRKLKESLDTSPTWNSPEMGLVWEKREEKEPLSDEDYAALRDAIADQQGLFDELHALVAMPDYDMVASAFSSKGDWPDFILYRELLKVIQAKARVASHFKNDSAVFENFWLGLEAVRAPEPASYLNQLVITNAIAVSAEECNPAVRRLESLPVLKDNFRKLRKDRTRIVQRPQEEQSLIDSISELKLAVAVGADIGIPPSGTRGDYFRIQLRHHLKQGIHFCSTRPLAVSVNALPFLLNNSIIAEYWYYQHFDWWSRWSDSPRIRLARGEAAYDLLRLSVARRIAELESKGPANPTEIDPLSLFEETPIDPYSESPYLWDETDEFFYSVGPDRRDNKALLLYDPTNGTLSQGDIFFR